MNTKEKRPKDPIFSHFEKGRGRCLRIDNQDVYLEDDSILQMGL